MARSKRDESEFVPKWEPTRDDVNKLRENIKPFTQIRIHGSLYSPFDQYCASINIIRIDPEGIVVLDPGGRTVMLETDSYRQSLDRFEQEKFYQTYPEEREKFMENIRAMRPANMIKRI